MTKKKKTGITIGVIVLVIAGFIGKYQYDQYRAEENLKLAEMRSVFLIVNPEDKVLGKQIILMQNLKSLSKIPRRLKWIQEVV